MRGACGVLMIALVVEAAADRSAKAGEAAVQLRDISKRLKTEVAGRGALPRGRVGPTPATKCCDQPGRRCAPNPTQWSSPIWDQLGFAIDDPFQFQYSYESDGTAFVATATGDPTCSGAVETYEVRGKLTSGSLVVGEVTKVGAKPADPSAPKNPPVQLAPPPLEVEATIAKVDLPAPPAFTSPPASMDGSRPVRDIRVNGARWHDREVAVRGYVTWVYDCFVDVQGLAKMPPAEVVKLIEADPSRCRRASFLLADSPTALPDTALHVTDVCVGKPGCAVPAVGDEVVAIGRIVASPASSTPVEKRVSIRDPLGFEHELAFRDLINRTKNNGAPAIPSTSPNAAIQTTEPTLPGVVPSPAVDPQQQDASLKHLASAEAALREKNFERAEAAAESAATAWPGNHRAWYSLGTAKAGRKSWAHARRAFERAVGLIPSDPMYQLWLGIAALETDDLSSAYRSLRLAIRGEPRLWRAHAALARIALHDGRASEAARSLVLAIGANPKHGTSYVRLATLYRRWGFLDEAIKVASSGLQHVVDSELRGELFLALGVAQLEKTEDQAAIGAFTKALDERKDLHHARFYRGLARARRKNPEARADLEIVLKSSVDQVLKGVALALLAKG